MKRLALISAAAVVWIAACTYDFDAAFDGSSNGGAGGAAGGSPPASSTGGAGPTVGGSGPGGSDVGGAAGMGGTSAGGSIVPGNEDCTNGVDDDDDMLLDCDDPDCTTHACVEPPPMDWVGVAFVAGPAAMPLDACGMYYTTNADYDLDLDAPPATCDACICAPPVVTCNDATWASYNSSNCNNQTGTFGPTASGQCGMFSINDLDGSSAPTPSVQSASCAASGGDANVPAATWLSHSRVCGDPVLGMGCGTGVCAPRSTGGLSVCVLRNGDHACPGSYTEKTLVYTNYNDSRDCGGCTCASPSGQSCSGSVEIWRDDDSCNGNADHVTLLDSVCNGHPGGGVNDGSYMFTVTGNANACTPQGGSPTGQAQPTGAITVCCLP